MKTTAIYPNRKADKKDLEKKLSLDEFGDEETEFYYNGVLVAKGYIRVVYGDHGPYVEFRRRHFKKKLFGRFKRAPKKLPKTSKWFYFWMFPRLCVGLKVYWQIKPVTNLPNAPRREDGKRSNFNREEGYADYKRNRFYINPYDFTKIK